MSKFNGTKKAQPNETNMAGGVSYTRPIKKEITSVILNSMLNGDSYYETEKTRINRIEDLLKTGVSDDAEFVAKAMVYTRNEGRLRSVSHVMAGFLAENVKGESFLKNAFVKSIVRPDDMTEIVALWNSKHKGSMIPNSLRRAFKQALETKFDEYQFRKYAGLNATVKLKDVVKLAHPSPKNFEDKTIFKRVIEDELKEIETAQTVNAGKTGEERVDAYVSMIKENKLGYMGAVKNVRTMLESGITEEGIKLWANLITDPKRITKSMLLPFRFVDAWDSVKDLKIDEFKKRIVKNALERAFGLSAGNTNIAEPGEKVAILLDESGSMGGMGWSTEVDKTKPFYIGKTLASAMKVGMDNDKCLFYTWADTCTLRDVNNMSPFDFIRNLNTRGGGTDVAAPMKLLITTGTFVDKIVIMTDMQMYGLGSLSTYINEYRNKVNPNVKILFWNLQGYGKGSPIDLEKTMDVFEVAGYSDQMLQVIPKLWNDKNFLIKEIEAITL